MGNAEQRMKARLWREHLRRVETNVPAKPVNLDQKAQAEKQRRIEREKRMTDEQREERRAKQREYRRRYRASMSEEQHQAELAKNRERYANDPEYRRHVLDMNKEWVARNREHVNAYDREYRKAMMADPEYRERINKRQRDKRARKKETA